MVRKDMLLAFRFGVLVGIAYEVARHLVGVAGNRVLDGGHDGV